MTIFTERRIGQTYLEAYEAPIEDVLGATAEQAWETNPLPSIMRRRELKRAERGVAPNILDIPLWGDPAPSTASPMVSSELARKRIQEEGVPLTIPDSGIRQRALDVLIDRKRNEMLRNSRIERGGGGFMAGTAQFGVGLGVSAVDPLNVASAFIPVVGQARYASALGRAAGLGGRIGVRARIGALEGAVGAAAVEPFVYSAASAEQADYDMTDSLLNMAFGTALGGGLHVGLAAGGDWRTAKPGTPLGRVIDAQPIEVKEAALRTAVAQAVTGREIELSGMITGRMDQGVMRAGGAAEFAPVTAFDEVLGIDGIKVFQGSPHEYDVASSAHIGSGEGSQSYGHGLYYAEAQRVGEIYRKNLTDNEGTSVLIKGESIEQFISRLMPAEQDMARFALETVSNMGDVTKAKEWLSSSATRPEKYLGVRAYEQKALDWITAHEEDIKATTPGFLYEARLRAKEEDFLDWDRPLSEQSEKVKAALLNNSDPSVAGTASKWGRDVPAMYSRLSQRAEGGQAAISQMLREAGIPGIKYLDQGSRAAGEGSRNYVVFSDDIIRTVRRNEQSLLPPPPESLSGRVPSPDEYRLVDPFVSRQADEAIKVAPKDEDFPEQALSEVMEDLTALASAMDAEFRAKRAPKPMRLEKMPDPEKKMLARPVLSLLKSAGGVRIGSPLAGELNAMGVTAKNAPGLFRRGRGIGAADNFVFSEHPMFARASDDQQGYIPEGVVLEALRDEMFGAPWRSPEQQLEIDAYLEAQSRGGVISDREVTGHITESPPVESEDVYGAMIERELADYDILAETADAYGRAVQAAALCQLGRGV